MVQSFNDTRIWATYVCFYLLCGQMVLDQSIRTPWCCCSVTALQFVRLLSSARKVARSYRSALSTSGASA
eukprot:2656258-Rhodomonas_salina.1